MNAEKLQELKEQIDTAKENKAKAEGQMDQIKSTWEKDFDCKDEDEVMSEIKTTQEQINTLKEKYESTLNKIEEAVGE